MTFAALLFTTQSGILMTLKKEALENTAGIGENPNTIHFLPFP